MFQITRPTTAFSMGSRSTIVPYFVLTILLNITLSLAIMARLLYVRRSVISVLGTEHAKTYTSVSAMVVESAALTAVVGVFALVCYIQNNVVLHFSLGLYDQVVVSDNTR